VKKILLFTPKVSASNVGDAIIYKSCVEEIDDLYPQAFKVDISTHMPVGGRWLKRFNDVDKRFVLGSNILGFSFPKAAGNWSINPLSIPHLKNSILMGVGWRSYKKSFSSYERFIYKNILENKYVHSVRDSFTQERLKQLGIDSINTGCPTMWKLDEDHCAKIPTNKSENVIATITDYDRVPERDLQMFNTLIKNYKQVYVWVQGYFDYDYLKELNLLPKVKIINPTLEAYEETLSNLDCDYVGTRLHAGIKALQYKKRSLIISIDNRAIEKGKDFNLPVLSGENMSELESKVNSKFPTNIRIPIDNIQKWKNQFIEKG
jgi:polysaccharide pyruvyl transferase WcaK-like protein